VTRRILVVGLRATGEAVVGHFARAGDRVTVVEEDPGQPSYAARVAAVGALGAELVERPAPEAWEVLVASSDLVVPSPGVRPGHPVYVAALAQGVPVRSDVDVAVELASVPVVAVTGTNGKTTVTTLVTDMLRASGVRAVSAGNIGVAALGVLDVPMDVLVVEVSSFQLHATTSTFRPRVAVLLNIADDHLDWHGSFAAYAEAKAQVFAHQSADDVLVSNVDDAATVELARRAPGRRLGFGAHAAPGVAGIARGALLGPDGAVLAAADVLSGAAPHDRLNAAAAAAAAREFGARPSRVSASLRDAPRLHHRTEPVGKAGGVAYVDDSKATNPHATLAALAAYAPPDREPGPGGRREEGGERRVVLLAGGVAKGVDLSVLRPAVGRVRAVVTIGATPEVVEQAFAGLVPTVRAASMREAVRTAAGLAHDGDTVLLSPACASFDWYRSYEERGADFRREVEALVAETATTGKSAR